MGSKWLSASEHRGKPSGRLCRLIDLPRQWLSTLSIDIIAERGLCPLALARPPGLDLSFNRFPTNPYSEIRVQSTPAPVRGNGRRLISQNWTQNTMTEPNEVAEAEAEDLNPFHIARRQFDRSMPYLAGIKRGLIDFLKTPARQFLSAFRSKWTTVRSKISSGTECCTAASAVPAKAASGFTRT